MHWSKQGCTCPHRAGSARRLCGAIGLMLVAMAGCASPAQALAPPQQMAFYADLRDKPLGQRVMPAGPAVIDWQHQINLKYGQDIRPVAAGADHPLIPVVRQVVDELPPQIKRLAERYLLALYLIEKDFGSGTTEAVRSPDGTWRHAYIALNLTELGRTANAWATWKERSTFRDAPGYDLRMTIEDDAQDTVAGAVRFILLHELGHVLGLGLQAHGFWDAESLPDATRDSPYLRISWAPTADGHMKSHWRREFPLLDALNFYSFGEAELSLDRAPKVYEALAGTDFPSLYGATNVFDDVAEAFAIYVHTRMLGRLYRVQVYEHGELRTEFRSCIETGACADKIAALERLLDISSGAHGDADGTRAVARAGGRR
jgi:hypothetical protein